MNDTSGLTFDARVDRLRLIANELRRHVDPPIGTTLFITSSIAKVRIGDVVWELIPFYCVAFALLMGFAYIPWLTIY